jgi:hypothetical protein
VARGVVGEMRKPLTSGPEHWLYFFGAKTKHYHLQYLHLWRHCVELLVVTAHASCTLSSNYWTITSCSRSNRFFFYGVSCNYLSTTVHYCCTRTATVIILVVYYLISEVVH